MTILFEALGHHGLLYFFLECINFGLLSLDLAFQLGEQLVLVFNDLGVVLEPLNLSLELLLKLKLVLQEAIVLGSRVGHLDCDLIALMLGNLVSRQQLLDLDRFLAV